MNTFNSFSDLWSVSNNSGPSLKSSFKDWLLNGHEEGEIYDLCRRSGCVGEDYYKRDPDDWVTENAFVTEMRKSPSLLNSILTNPRALNRYDKLYFSE